MRFLAPNGGCWLVRILFGVDKWLLWLPDLHMLSSCHGQVLSAGICYFSTLLLCRLTAYNKRKARKLHFINDTNIKCTCKTSQRQIITGNPRSQGACCLCLCLCLFFGSCKYIHWQKQEARRTFLLPDVDISQHCCQPDARHVTFAACKWSRKNCQQLLFAIQFLTADTLHLLEYLERWQNSILF